MGDSNRREKRPISTPLDEYIAMQPLTHQGSGTIGRKDDPAIVSVVIVNWNGGEAVLECLRHVLAQTRPPDEIIVVDNASTDGSLEAIAREFPGVQVVENESNLGYGGGVNRGVALATGKWVALLNNDAMADARWLEEMLAVAQPSRFGMVACKIYLDREADVLDKVGHVIAVDGQNFGRGHGLEDDGRYEALEEVAWPDGCAGLWLREEFERLGGIDEEFFAYADDADLGIRFRLAGWRSGLAPRAIVEHRHSQSLGAYSPEKLFLVERNRIWLVMKYFPWPLVLLNPAVWAWRAFLTRLGSRGDAGPWARVSHEDRANATRAILRAQIAGWRGLGSQLRKRARLAKLCGPAWRRRMRALLKAEHVSLADLARGRVR